MMIKGHLSIGMKLEMEGKFSSLGKRIRHIPISSGNKRIIPPSLWQIVVLDEARSFQGPPYSILDFLGG